MIDIRKINFIVLFLIALLSLLIFSCCEQNEEHVTAFSTEATDITTTEENKEESSSYASSLTSFDFMRANSLTNALGKYSTVKITNTSEDNSIYTKSFFLFDGKPVMLEICKIEDEGEEFYGWFDGYDLKLTEEGVVAEKYVETLFDSPSFYYEDEISLMFDGKNFNIIEETDESYVFNVTYPQMDIRETRYYTVSKSTLLLQKAEIFLEGEFYKSITFEYGASIDDYGILDALNGNYKKISLSCLLEDATKEINVTIDIPESWEFIPLHRVSQLSMYLDKDFTHEYIYPGDGISFSMFCTDSAG